jgi:hypothetical protein
MFRIVITTNLVWSIAMLNFEKLVARHGEIGVQAIIERIERTDGVSARGAVSLEERWQAVMKRDLPADNRRVA